VAYLTGDDKGQMPMAEAVTMRSLSDAQHDA
jgi:hypothetical protein